MNNKLKTGTYRIERTDSSEYWYDSEDNLVYLILSHGYQQWREYDSIGTNTHWWDNEGKEYWWVNGEWDDKKPVFKNQLDTITLDGKTYALIEIKT